MKTVIKIKKQLYNSIHKNISYILIVKSWVNKMYVQIYAFRVRLSISVIIYYEG